MIELQRLAGAALGLSEGSRPGAWRSQRPWFALVDGCPTSV